jgi:hypothetical protein
MEECSLACCHILTEYGSEYCEERSVVAVYSLSRSRGVLANSTCRDTSASSIQVCGRAGRQMPVLRYRGNNRVYIQEPPSWRYKTNEC